MSGSLNPNQSETGTEPLAVDIAGFDLLSRPLLNKGTAFSDAERNAFDLHGLLPPNVLTLEEQLARRLAALRAYETPLEKYTFLRDLQDNNETLFYALIVRHIEEVLPLIYTPTVGEACQRFSEIFRKPRGLFLSYPNRSRIAEMLAHPRYDDVRVIVVSDGERILGLGDQGAGGMGIPIGKLSLYTGCAGIHPGHTLPILLDTGTNNPERLADPLYIGWRHERVRGAEYDDFVESFVSAVEKRWPHVLLQWEDFAGANAGRLLARYRDRLCTFNDDIQGTAAVAAGTLLSAINVTGIPLKEQRVALLGAGSAGIGICSLIVSAMVEAGLSREEAFSRFYAVDRDGLLVEGMSGILPAQEPFVTKRSAVAGWTLEHPSKIGLFDVVANAKPTVLIGVSGQPGTFTEAAIRTMAKSCARPVIFPLSNPTARSEATAADIMRWTDGRALIGTGSPFPPVEREGRLVPVDQTNNSYIFPGAGLGILAVRARRVTDAMFMAAAKALAALSPARTDKNGRLLPELNGIRAVSEAVALAVARQAQADGVAQATSEDALESAIRATIWEPAYRPYIRKKA
ncbi:MAG TPA: NAD-dependent malic enzyme [Acetobacteraceae bacterium]|nr:NAD-dependent malic enzyme [Acetobacteraceae bacterium]